jgi:hypothetical protein
MIFDRAVARPQARSESINPSMWVTSRTGLRRLEQKHHARGENAKEDRFNTPVSCDMRSRDLAGREMNEARQASSGLA